MFALLHSARPRRVSTSRGLPARRSSTRCRSEAAQRLPHHFYRSTKERQISELTGHNCGGEQRLWNLGKCNRAQRRLLFAPCRAAHHTRNSRSRRAAAPATRSHRSSRASASAAALAARRTRSRAAWISSSSGRSSMPLQQVRPYPVAHRTVATVVRRHAAGRARSQAPIPHLGSRPGPAGQQGSDHRGQLGQGIRLAQNHQSSRLLVRKILAEPGGDDDRQVGAPLPDDPD